MGQWIQIPTPPYWAYDPDAPEGDVSATSLLPVYAAPAAEPEQRTEPATGPIPQVQFLAQFGPDTGDMIDPQAPDPAPDEITDPQHPDFVDPWRPE